MHRSALETAVLDSIRTGRVEVLTRSRLALTGLSVACWV